ncbi:beta-casein [Suricata suricatta]|uniref:beta-casein n=1 Tax=Suricata suricatta TaxID=37032 RepID=UPI0011556349|nr:beta-casein [Suricata suricatta]
MKVLILTCLVALALAREKEEFTVSSETVESVSGSEESTTHVNKQKLENFKLGEQQQGQDEHQNKIHPVFQPQPLVYPFAEPIPYPVLPQNVLPLAQPGMVLPFLPPGIMEIPKVKETIFPSRKVMPFLKSPIVPLLDSQILSLTDLENLQIPLSLPLPLLQPLMHQIPQGFPLLQTPQGLSQTPQALHQTPMLPPQPILSIPQSIPQPKVLPFPQQMVPYLQRDMPVPTLLLYQDATHEAQPVTAPVSNPIIVSPNLIILLSHL